jgi:hypothetical protein
MMAVLVMIEVAGMVMIGAMKVAVVEVVLMVMATTPVVNTWCNETAKRE